MLVTPENVEEVREELNKPIEDAYYEVNMNTEWVFKTALTPSDNAFVRNKETNTRTVFFDVVLEERDEIIYTSPYIPLGGELRNFALDTELEAGEYTPLVTYYLVDDDFNILTDVSIYVTLKIEG